MKKLRVAIIGCGDIAGGYDEKAPSEAIWTHVKAYQSHGNTEVVTAWDPDRTRLELFCRHWSIATPADNPLGLLDDFHPDIVSICSPNESHPEWLHKCLAHESVKGVLCEKPLALNGSTAEALGHSVRSTGKKVAVNYLRRWDRNFFDLIREYKSGVLGEAISGRVLYTKGVFHNASHAINLMEALFGPAKCAQMISSAAVSGQDLLANFFLTFANGARIWFEFLNHENFNHFDIDFHTDRARVRSPGGGTIEVQTRTSSALQSGTLVLGPTTTRPATIGLAMKEVAGNLIDAVTKGTALLMPFEQAVDTTRTCEMIRREAERNRT